MVFSPHEQQDGFTHDFDQLVDLCRPHSKDSMGSLSVIENAAKRAAGRPLVSPLEHSVNHIDCPACQHANEELVTDSADLSTKPFPSAAGSWMRLRRQDNELRPRTHETNQGYLDSLEKFFGRIRLCDITPGHVRGYQLARLSNLVFTEGMEIRPWKRIAGHSTINHEISVLGQMLTHCCLWHRIKPYYFPLGTPKWSPRTVLTEEEEERLWSVAAMHPDAALAYWVATITNHTTAAGIELRGLRLKHIFLNADICEIYIPEDSVKNNSRPRRIALNADARWAVIQCYKRAIKIGSCEPDHYLFPSRVRGNALVGTYDCTRPASRWFLRNSWNKLRKATGFTNLNPHDLRHHCITRLLENDVNENTVISIAGHVNRKMLEYYAHHRRRVKYAAVVAIEGKKKPVKSEKAPEIDRAVS